MLGRIEEHMQRRTSPPGQLARPQHMCCTLLSTWPQSFLGFEHSSALRCAQTARQAAEAAAAAIREAEDAAEHATRLESGSAGPAGFDLPDRQARAPTPRLPGGSSPPYPPSRSSPHSESRPGGSGYGWHPSQPAPSTWPGYSMPLSLQQQLSLRSPGADRGHREPPDAWASRLSRPVSPLDVLGAAAAAAEEQQGWDFEHKPL